MSGRVAIEIYMSKPMTCWYRRCANESRASLLSGFGASRFDSFSLESIGVETGCVQSSVPMNSLTSLSMAAV
jgi:hypothetical protein